jgi:hypothetical protein
VPPTKAELQTTHERCEQIRRGVSALETARDYLAAVKQAEKALSDQHASVTFQRRFLKMDQPVAPLVDVILRYAPAFFLGRSLDAVERWYDGGTKTERNALPAIPERLATARRVLAHAVELWGVLTRSPAATLRPSAIVLTNAVVPLWVAAGVIAPRPDDPRSFARVSDTRRNAVAKCSGCGRERTAPLVELLEPAVCPACRKRCHFVLTRRVFGP